MNNNGLLGLYQFETGKMVGHDEEGNEIVVDHQILIPWFENLITNAGLDLLGSSTNDNLIYCRLGTSTATPIFSDTSLGAQVGYTSTSGASDQTGISADGTYIYRRVTRRFSAGTVSGQVLAEVGMGNTSNGALFSRALIKEPGGSPITFTIPADQFLDVIYELRCYIDVADNIVAATVDGVPTNVTIRKHGTLSEAPWLELATVLGCGWWASFNANNRRTLYCLESQPAASSIPGWRGSDYINPTRSYVSGSYQLKLTCEIPLDQYNFATGIGAIVIGMSDMLSTRKNGTWSWGFDPKISKDNTKLATIEIGLSWGRHVP